MKLQMYRSLIRRAEKGEVSIRDVMASELGLGEVCCLPKSFTRHLVEIETTLSRCSFEPRRQRLSIGASTRARGAPISTLVVHSAPSTPRRR